MQTSEITVRWKPETSTRVASIQIQSRIALTNEWTEQAAAFDPTIGEFRFTSNAPATEVEVRTRYRMVSGVFGAWVSRTILTAAAVVEYDTVTGTPTKLADVNAVEGGKLDGISPGATVGAVVGGNLVDQNGQIWTPPVVDFTPINDRLRDIEKDISEIVVGESAAGTSARIAEKAAENALEAERQAKTARDASVAAQGLAEGAARDSATSASGAHGSATTASGQASIATQKASDASSSASIASAQATLAETAKGAAATSASNAATSETNAAGSASAAAISQSVSATSADEATRALLAQGRSPGSAMSSWVRDQWAVFRPATNLRAQGLVAVDGVLRHAGGVHIGPIAVTPLARTRRLTVGATARIVVDADQTGGGGHLCFISYFNESGGFLGTGTVGELADNSVNVASGVFTIERTLPITEYPAAAMYYRACFRTNGKVTTDILTIYATDGEEAARSKDSANAAATSASTAAASEGKAGQYASAASTSATNASTSAGNASTYASQASTSAANAAGSESNANTASSNAGVSASNAAGSASAAAGSASTASTASSNAAGSASSASTSATNAATSAGNASTYASQASTSATNAAGSASTASSSAGLAAGHAGNASTSASQANDAKIAASGSAAAAATSAILSARVSSPLSNNGAVFPDWPDTSNVPNYWAAWGPIGSRVTGQIGRYGYRQDAPAAYTEAGLQTGVNDDPGLASLGGGQYVIEAELTLESGSLEGSGVLFRSYDSTDSFSGGAADNYLHFSRSVSNVSPDVATGSGIAGRRYRFSRLCAVPANHKSVRIYLMTQWAGFEPRQTKSLTWHSCGIRPATLPEIQAGKVSSLEATVGTYSGAIAAVEGKVAAAYWKTAVSAGNGRAQLSLYADAVGGGGVDIVGDVAISGSQGGARTVVTGKGMITYAANGNPAFQCGIY